jgi:DNA-binding CsgD family transcriptional regulator
MLVDGDSRASAAVRHFPLGVAVADLYTDLRVNPLLRRLLTHSRGLLGTVAGSVSLVDTGRGRYDKIAENGVACELGRSFPLDEGATGQAVALRMPVVIDDYSHLRGGHLPPEHPASRGAAAAVPLWWRGEVIGVNVAFAGRSRRFTTAEVDAFELLTQSVASAVVKAGAAALRTSASRLHVAVVHRAEGLRLLVQDETTEAVAPSIDPLGLGTRTWNELLAAAGGGLGGEVGVEHVAGWGTLLRADFPTTVERPARPVAASPLTPRGNEVLRLLADGLSDREVAARLVISPKTVEKHVGAVLRKTGSASRTAAVVQAMERG